MKSRTKSPKIVSGAAAARYSGIPLPKKLGICDDYSVVLVNPPERFERKLEPLPAGAEMVTDPEGANVAVLFATSRAELARDFRPLAKSLPEKSAFWIAWPKQASGVSTDLKEDVVREFPLMQPGWITKFARWMKPGQGCAWPGESDLSSAAPSFGRACPGQSRRECPT